VGVESGRVISSHYDAVAQHVGWAVETMSRHVPWESRCLVNAISAWWMLNRRGVFGTVYFGVTHAPNNELNAHAWLRCGSRIVTGANGYERFRVLTCFSKGER
jgi:hypothetical protein